MKRVLIIVLLALAISLFAGCSVPEKDGNAEMIPDEGETLEYSSIEDILNSGSVFADASYSDPVNCFEDLLEAKLIVKVVVDEITSPASFTRRSAAAVKEVYSGKAENVIYVCQMANKMTLEKGKEYILFLNPQTDDVDCDEYYCLGGGYGSIMTVDDANNALLVNSSSVVDEDFESWLESETDYSFRLS